VPARLYATPSYLDRIGNPKLPYDLRNAEFVDLDRTDMLMNALNTMGMSLTIKNFPVMTENYTVMWELVKQGIGIGILDENIGDAEPLVQRVLPDLEPMMFPIWLVAHRELNTSRRIRRVFDLLSQELSKG